jgi:translation initiation factor eIF-2B subunit epsilon
MCVQLRVDDLDSSCLILKVNCFKLAQNKTFDECLSGAVAAILSLAIVPGDDNAGKFLIRLKAQIQHWSPLLKKLTQGLAEEVAFVTAVELLALSGPNSSFLAPHFARVVKLFYDTEIISDDGILKWANARRSEMKSGLRNSDSNRLFESDMTQKLIATLEEESEEEDENSDSS